MKKNDQQCLYVAVDRLIDGMSAGRSLVHLKFENGHLAQILRHLANRLEPSIENEILESLMRIEYKIYNKDNENDPQPQS